MINFSLDGILSFSIIPLRLAIWIGIAISILAFIYLAYILIIWIYSTDVVPGWASMTGLLALLGGIQLFTIGILGEYVGRHFVTSLKRPFYVVDQRLIEEPSYDYEAAFK